jgi:hypothetical protein
MYAARAEPMAKGLRKGSFGTTLGRISPDCSFKLREKAHMGITDSGKFVPGDENKTEKCGHDRWVHDTLHWLLRQLPSGKVRTTK